MDTLPEHVVRTILEATKNRNLISWRIFGEDNVQVTLKFTTLNTEPDQYGNIETASRAPYDRHYRSKPPSAVIRDNTRATAYRQQTDNSTDNHSTCVDTACNTFSTQYSKADNSLYSNNDSGIGQGHNGLPMFSTPVCNLPQTSVAMSQTPCNHNGINSETMCAIEMDHNATQTDIPSQSTIKIQTERPISRKFQTLNFNTQFKRTQTLPVPTKELSCQSENICSKAVETMTNNPFTEHTATNTEGPLEKHVQTHQVPRCDKAIGPCITEHSSQTKTVIKCKAVQVDTKYTTSLPIQGTECSDIWVESAVDYITRNQAILDDMRDGLDSLKYVCDKHS